MEKLYSIFKFLYGSSLHNYLGGYETATEDFTGSEQFLLYFLIAASVGLVLSALYYLVIKSVRFGTAVHWTILLLATAGLSWLICTTMVAGDIDKGHTPENVHFANALMFGLANAIITALVFFASSLVLRYFSKPLRYTPF